MKAHLARKDLTLRYRDLACALEHRGRWGEALDVLAEGREAPAPYKPGPGGPGWLRTEVG